MPHLPPPPAPDDGAGRIALRSLFSGTLAGLLSLAVLMWRGRTEHGSAASLVNSPSHWVHGERALRANSVSARHTLLGALIHQASSVFWALFFEWAAARFLGRLMRRARRVGRRGAPVGRSFVNPSAWGRVAAAPLLGTAAGVVGTAAGVTALAWLVDTRLVPPRLRPGFERRLSRRGMAWTYGAFGLGLALGGAWLLRTGPGAVPDGQAAAANGAEKHP